MKKFWNLMLAALVIFGAVACTENQEENIPQEEQKAVLSFVANIDVDETRTDLKEVEDGKWITEWSGDDILYVYNYKVSGDAFEFKNSKEDPNVFKCTDERVLQLIGEPVQIDNSDNFNSTTGKKGGSLYADVDNFQPNANISLTVNSSFFRFSSYFDVTLELSSPDEENYEAFVLDDGTYSKTVTLDSGDDVWVAFKTYSNCTLTAKINDQVIKTKSGVDFSDQMIYNLGELGEKVPNESFGIVGGHQGWNTANKDAMYLIPGSNTYVRYDVKLNSEGFKIYGETSKTVTIEHPEVTGGETGYLFLKPNSNWTQANARFAAYFFGNGTEWISMTDSNKDGIYAVQKPSKTYPNVIFCRMNPSASANNWDNKWNQTGDLEIPTDGKNLFTVPSGSWDGSTTSWSKHTPVEHQDAWTEVTEEITSYWFGKNGSDKISDWVTGYSNNAGNDNITVDTTKTYDIYFSRDADQDWGFVYYFAVKESNSEAPELK